MFRPYAAPVCLLGLALSTPLPAQEPVEIHNWSAPPFWSLPARMSRPDVPEPEVGSLEPAEALEVLGGLPTSPLPFVGINPCRIADTRGNGFTGQAGPPTLPAFTTRVFQVAGTVAGVPAPCGIPLTAQAVSFQFTVTSMVANGNLIAWPEGAPPTTSVLNWNANSVAIGSGTVVALSGTGTLSVRINGQGADLIIDVNGYYGDNFDSLYVNEGQTSSITSAMITDGAIVNADINASAAIADTKLATIATDGKVADSALSANVTKLGQTIEASEITNITRTISIPLSSFLDCESTAIAFLKVASGNDDRADFDGTGPGAGGNGAGFNILFDTLAGLEDQNTEICSQLAVPQDYVSGGQFRILMKKIGDTGATEVLNCALGRNLDPMEAPGVVTIIGAVPVHVTCVPTLPAGLTAGDTLRFYLSITSSGTMNDQLRLYSVAFEYTAAQ